MELKFQFDIYFDSIWLNQIWFKINQGTFLQIQEISKDIKRVMQINARNYSILLFNASELNKTYIYKNLFHYFLMKYFLYMYIFNLSLAI